MCEITYYVVFIVMVYTGTGNCQCYDPPLGHGDIKSGTDVSRQAPMPADDNQGNVTSKKLVLYFLLLPHIFPGL